MDYALEDFNLSTTPEKMVEIFTAWLEESKPYHDDILRHQTEAEKYYLGDQTDKNDIPAYLSNTVLNRIFEAVETMVPIVTSSAHQFIATPAGENPASAAKSKIVGDALIYQYEHLNIQELLERVTRNMMIRRYGVLKWFWNSDKDDVDVKEIDPRLIIVPKLRLDPHDLPYVMEIQGYTEEEMEDLFGKEKTSQAAKGQGSVSTGAKDKDTDSKLYQVFEVWTDKVVAWFAPGVMLDRKENPFYDFTGTTKKKYDAIRGKIVKENKFYNHLNEPEKPFIFFTPFNISDGPLPDISLVEIGMPVQDSINDQKRSIINNSKQMGNGQLLIDSETMTEEESENLTNQPGLIIRGKGAASENRVRREAGVPIPSSHFSNLQHSEMVFDNIMSVHSSTRGVAAAKTLGQDILSRQQDYTRIDTFTRILNRGVSRLANGLVQLMKMFYDETHLFKLVGEEGAIAFVSLNRDNIEDNINIVVKSGQNLPMDDISLRTEAVQLWQLGAISPITLFKRLKFTNPELEAANLLAWKQGQLDMETQAAIQQAQAGAAAEGGPKVETPETAGQGRGTESVLDVLARAKKALGGTAAKAAPNTSNQNKS